MTVDYILKFCIKKRKLYMNRKIFIVPIANLTAEKPLLISNFSLISFKSYHDLNVQIDVSDFLTEEHKKYKIGYLSLVEDKKFYLRDFPLLDLDLFRDHKNAINTTFCIFELNEDNLIKNILDKTYKYESSDINDLDVSNICNKVNPVLDFIIFYSGIGFNDRLQLPLMPGLTNDGFRRFYYINNKEAKQVMSDNIYHIPQKGIGINLDDLDDNEDNYGISYNNIYYNIIFGNRYDEIASLCRNILHKINEVLYMPSLEASFIFLMSAFETLASKDYINFQKAKSKILPFISRDISEYNKLSDFFRKMSKEYRTEVIHNGKTLFELHEGKSEDIIKELNKIRGLLIKAVVNIYESKCDTYDDLNVYRENLKNTLGIN
ncbi:hypothetical protein [Rodentibacter rarus]|nr:hypothetical protein [Rodentibacter rarus]